MTRNTYTKKKKKKKLLNTKFVFQFFLQCFSEKFLILGTIQRGVMVNAHVFR